MLGSSVAVDDRFYSEWSLKDLIQPRIPGASDVAFGAIQRLSTLVRTIFRWSVKGSKSLQKAI